MKNEDTKIAKIADSIENGMDPAEILAGIAELKLAVEKSKSLSPVWKKAIRSLIYAVETMLGI